MKSLILKLNHMGNRQLLLAKNAKYVHLLCLENSICFLRSNHTSTLMNYFLNSLVVDYSVLLELFMCFLLHSYYLASLCVLLSRP